MAAFADVTQLDPQLADEALANGAMGRTNFKDFRFGELPVEIYLVGTNGADVNYELDTGLSLLHGGYVHKIGSATPESGVLVVPDAVSKEGYTAYIAGLAISSQYFLVVYGDKNFIEA